MPDALRDLRLGASQPATIRPTDRSTSERCVLDMLGAALVKAGTAKGFVNDKNNAYQTWDQLPGCVQPDFKNMFAETHAKTIG